VSKERQVGSELSHSKNCALDNSNRRQHMTMLWALLAPRPVAEEAALAPAPQRPCCLSPCPYCCAASRAYAIAFI